jgi:tripartite ATP-independent transporter DctM subunit
MPWYEAAGLMVGLALVLIALSVPIGFAFLLANLVGFLVFIGGSAAITQLIANATTAVTSFALVPVPLFILMGELFYHTGIASRVFDVVDKLLGKVPGRLSYVTITGGTLFAALSGSSMANTAMLGSTLLPEMTRRGYKNHLSMGPIVAVGGLAVLIPPSGLAVLLGSMANLDIGKMLVSGIVPGILLAALYAVVVAVSTYLDPDAAPTYPVEPIPLREKIALLVTDVLPMSIVIFMVVGLMILGVATPTEAAAFGALGALMVAVGFRALTWESIRKSIEGAVKVTGMVFLIILASTSFSQILAISGASTGLVRWVGALAAPPLVVLLMIALILLVLGMLMESVAIMLLTIPIFFPLIRTMGFDDIWFGQFMLLLLEIGLLTPPFGLNLFVLQGVAPQGTTIGQVAWASMPYILCGLLVAVFLVIFPDLALWLPSRMR